MQDEMLRDLYQEVILDHNRNPRNCCPLADANYQADGFNPLCGDKIQLFLQVNQDDVIENVTFTGNGCAISIASASLMTERLKGMSLDQAKHLFAQMHVLLTDSTADDVDDAAVGKLAVLAGVKTFPARVKCATLAWHTLNNAINNQDDMASTE